jgi:hypothetical protein
MFLFNRSFGAALAGLSVALLFVCVDRACEVPVGDQDLPRVIAAAPSAAEPVASAAYSVLVVTAPVADAGIAIPTS